MPALPLPAAATELGISVPTLRRWVRAGAPVVQRGRRGRGANTLVNPDDIAAWRGLSTPTDTTALQVFGAQLPQLVATAVAAAYREVEGPHKHLAAGVLAGAWYVVTTQLLDRLRDDVPELSDPQALPPEIDQLRDVYSRNGLLKVRGPSMQR